MGLQRSSNLEHPLVEEGAEEGEGLKILALVVEGVEVRHRMSLPALVGEEVVSVLQTSWQHLMGSLESLTRDLDEKVR